MKTALTTIALSTVLSFSALAQNSEKRSDPADNEVRRLDSVTWDLKSHKLSWTVQKGTEVKGEFIPSSAEHYEITPDVATMKVRDEKRGFEPDEAALLHRLLDTISVYCAQSVVWWDHGEGIPLTDGADRAVPEVAKPAPPAEKKPAAKPYSTPVKKAPLGIAEVLVNPQRPER